MAELFNLPSSLVVIGYVVKSFDLYSWDPGEKLSSRQASRCFAGQVIGPDARLDILRAVVHALRDSGVLEPLPPIDPTLTNAFAASEASGEGQDVRWLHALAADWDAIAGVSCSPRPRVSSRPLAGYATLQMVMVDLSVRLAGLLELRGAAEPPSLPSYWFRPEGIGDWLRCMMDEAGLTGEELAARAGVAPNTVDTWRAGTRPQEHLLRRLARALAKTEAATSDLLRALRLAYGMNALFALVGSRLGLQAATACAERLSTYPTALRRFMRQSRPGSRETWLAVLFGTVHKPTWLHHGLRRVADAELDPVWRTTLQEIQRGWLRRLRSVAQRLDPRLDEWVTRYLDLADSTELQRTTRYLLLASHRELSIDVVQHGVTRRAATSGELVHIALAVLMSRPDEATAQRAAREVVGQLVQLQPGSAAIHWLLACLLQKTGDPNAALVELDIAAQLAPDWDAPSVALGVALGNAGRDPEALRRLEAHAASQQRRTPQVLLLLARCYARAGEHDRAIETYTELTRSEPQHALALDELAHLTLLRGAPHDGANLAKKAAQRGVTATFDAWRSRRYRARAWPGRRPVRKLPAR